MKILTALLLCSSFLTVSCAHKHHDSHAKMSKKSCCSKDGKCGDKCKIKGKKKKCCDKKKN